MHAAYNTQILVIKGLVFSYYVSQSRSDYKDFIPTIDRFYSFFNTYPTRICADAGYGTYENYEYLENHSIENYVKFTSWEGNVSGTMPDSYTIKDDNTIVCLNNKIGVEIEIFNRHPRAKNSVFYRVVGCNNCNFEPYCKRFMKNQNDNEKIFEVNKKMQHYKQQALTNLLTIKGIEIRVNRSVQVEGVFGIQKQNYGNVRFRRRGLKKTSVECMLNFLGFNVAKLFRFYETNKQNTYWVAPQTLLPQKLIKPSWKKLIKKGRKINKKIYKE